MAGWLSTALGALGGAAGTVLGGPMGSLAGGAGGSLVGTLIDGWLSSEDDGPAAPGANLPGMPDWAVSGTGLDWGGGASGGGGAGSSWEPPSASASGGAMIPAHPSGGLQGPAYGTQLSGAAQTALSTVMTMLRAYPYISDHLQRFWDFPSQKEVTAPKSPALWRAVAGQLPKANREALYQFLVGFPSPIGLTKAQEDIFFTLKVAEAGYTPEQIGCCPEVK